MSRQSRWSSALPLPYTANPAQLALYDLLLFVRITFAWPLSAGIPTIVLPLLPFRSGRLDELYPTPANIWSVLVQLGLTVSQIIFVLVILLSTLTGFPLGFNAAIYLLSIVGYVLVNKFVSNLLVNGPRHTFISNPKLFTDRGWDVNGFPEEKWIFINGVAAGSHWLQSNLDRLSLTFRRPIMGIHNQTRGIVFDVFESILQRTFNYGTPDIRTAYAEIAALLMHEPQYKKIVLILHSQGAIEGGLVLDWLLASVGTEMLRRIEVYTFGNAANHFNDPVLTSVTPMTSKPNGVKRATSSKVARSSTAPNSSMDEKHERVITYIEHYANSEDWVARFGILNFRSTPLNDCLNLKYLSGSPLPLENPPAEHSLLENRYFGRLFIRQGSGHQMNGNYLDNFFRMDAGLTTVIDDEQDGDLFMDQLLDKELLEDWNIVVVKGVDVGVCEIGGYQKPKILGIGGATETTPLVNGTSTPKMREKGVVKKKATTSKVEKPRIEEKPLDISQVSRLWHYRNGLSPVDD